MICILTHEFVKENAAMDQGFQRGLTPLLMLERQVPSSSQYSPENLEEKQLPGLVYSSKNGDGNLGCSVFLVPLNIASACYLALGK